MSSPTEIDFSRAAEATLVERIRRTIEAMDRSHQEILEELLEDAYNGLWWWMREHPEDVSEADFEKLREIEKALGWEVGYGWQDLGNW